MDISWWLTCLKLKYFPAYLTRQSFWHQNQHPRWSGWWDISYFGWLWTTTTTDNDSIWTSRAAERLITIILWLINPTMVEKSTMDGNPSTIWKQLKIGLGPRKKLLNFFAVENEKFPKNNKKKNNCLKEWGSKMPPSRAAMPCNIILMGKDNASWIGLFDCVELFFWRSEINIFINCRNKLNKHRKVLTSDFLEKIIIRSGL